MSRTRPAWNAPADDWCRETAARMHAQGCHPGTIIDHLEAYGCGFHAAQALVRDLVGPPLPLMVDGEPLCDREAKPTQRGLFDGDR